MKLPLRDELHIHRSTGTGPLDWLTHGARNQQQLFTVVSTAVPSTDVISPPDWTGWHGHLLSCDLSACTSVYVSASGTVRHRAAI